MRGRRVKQLLQRFMDNYKRASKTGSTAALSSSAESVRVEVPGVDPLILTPYFWARCGEDNISLYRDDVDTSGAPELSVSASATVTSSGGVVEDMSGDNAASFETVVGSMDVVEGPVDVDGAKSMNTDANASLVVKVESVDPVEIGSEVKVSSEVEVKPDSASLVGGSGIDEHAKPTSGANASVSNSNKTTNKKPAKKNNQDPEEAPVLTFSNTRPPLQLRKLFKQYYCAMAE
jgi:hypothetical protein